MVLLNKGKKHLKIKNLEDLVQKMSKLSESYIRKVIREVISESLILEISAEEKTKVMGKSNERVPFNAELMKQAILQGREVGMNFQTNNEKTKMPVAKARVIHPVAIGRDKNGNLVVRGLHITGQSEKAARETGIRSAEAEAEKDGINAWRLFRGDNIRSMWFTDRFFSDSIPGFNPNDKAMSSKMAVYNPAVAKSYQDSIVSKSKEVDSEEDLDGTQPQSIEPQQRPQQNSPQNKLNKDIDQLGYEDQPIQEKRKGVRNLFK